MLANPFNQTRGPSIAPASYTFSTLPSASSVAPRQPFFVSDIGVNGSWWFSNGTKWAPLNGSCLLFQGSMPFVNFGSGSIAADGSLTAIPSLIRTYPKVWGYFPANAVATVAAAGFRYCTIASATTGTVFLDTPSAWPLTWPASPTAVTDGKGAFTATSANAATPTVTIPANAMGLNGYIEMKVAGNRTSTGNSTSISMWVNGASKQSGTITNNGFDARMVMANVNAANRNTFASTVLMTTNITVQNTNIDTVDTSSSFTLGFQTQNLTPTTNNCEVVNYTATLFNDGQ